MSPPLPSSSPSSVSGAASAAADPAVLLARIPVLRGLDPAAFTVTPVPDTAPASDPLVVIEGLGEALVARLPAPAADPAALAGRRAEAEALALAGRLGLAPPTVVYDPEDGFWVMLALSGARLDDRTPPRGAQLTKMATALRRLHVSGMTLSPRRDPFEALRISGECIRHAPPSLPADGLHAITDVARECRVALIGTTPDPVPCLNAPWPWVYLDTGTRVLLLDWRAAAMGDPHHELACLCETQGLDAERERRLLRAYIGADQGRGQDRVRVFRLLAAHARLMDGLASGTADGTDDGPAPRARLADLMSRCRAIIESSAWNQSMERLSARASLSPTQMGPAGAEQRP